MRLQAEGLNDREIISKSSSVAVENYSSRRLTLKRADDNPSWHTNLKEDDMGTTSATSSPRSWCPPPWPESGGDRGETPSFHTNVSSPQYCLPLRAPKPSKSSFFRSWTPSALGIQSTMRLRGQSMIATTGNHPPFHSSDTELSAPDMDIDDQDPGGDGNTVRRWSLWSAWGM